MRRIVFACLLALVSASGCGGDDAGKGSTGGGSGGGPGGSGGTGASGGTGGTAGASGSAGTGGTAGAGGSAGTGGTAGAGGSAGTGGTAGAGGSAGTGGTAGAGGSAGTGGTAGAGGGAGTGGAAGASGSAGAGGTAGASGSAGAGGTCAGGAGGAGGMAGSVTCGCAPYVKVRVFANTLLAGPTGDVAVTGDQCSGDVSIPHTTFDDIFVQDLKPFHLSATQAGSFDFLTPEYLPDASSIFYQFLGYFGVSTLMVADTTNFNAIDPLWNTGTQAAIQLETANADGASGACTGHGGVTYTVAGHPETIAAYSGSGTSTGTGSGDGGVQLFFTTTGTIAAPEMVTVVGTRSGCSVKTTAYVASGAPTAQTGNVPVAAGATTGLLLAVVDN